MYTVSAEADKKVQADLDRIVDKIRQRIDPVSIILFGGFGKGEGSFDLRDGDVRPLNDYDLYVITRTKKSDRFIEEVAAECARAIGRGGEEFCEQPAERYDADRFFHVDLRQIVYADLRKLKPVSYTHLRAHET